MKEAIIAIVAFLVFVVAINELEIGGIKLWGVRRANAERLVYENTNSYINGKKQELVKYHHEWMVADSVDKPIIEATIRNSFAEFDENKIDETLLREFLKDVKYK